jgi:hypothetical protein
MQFYKNYFLGIRHENYSIVLGKEPIFCPIHISAKSGVKVDTIFSELVRPGRISRAKVD